MLETREIFNFGLIPRAVLELDRGLNVLTGETGAGKSVALEALGFLLGGPGPGGPCRVEGRFGLNDPAVRASVQEWGLLDPAENEVVISREVSASGRGIARVNGRLCAQVLLRRLGEQLADFHAQHRHLTLLRPSRHLELLDRSAGTAHQALVQDCSALHAQVEELAARLEALHQAERERTRELEWLQHELDEILQAAVSVGEEEELLAEARRLAAAEELTRGAASSAGHLEGLALDQAERGLRGLIRHDPALEAVLHRLAEARVLLDEARRELTGYAEQACADPQRLEQVEARLDLLRKLKRKYGADLSEVLAYARRAEARLAELQGADRRGQEMQAELEALRAQRAEVARALSRRRAEAARDLQGEVEAELAALAMPGARFEVRLEPLDEPGPRGAERVEFFLAPNPGVPAQPLAKAASGGELSRVMLALAAVFSRFESVPLLVFDEVDAGLGGQAAEAVASRLREMGRRCQIVCVTHLAVVAAASARHIRLRKEVRSGTTRILADALTGEARERELARMLSGDATREAARRHARDLLSPVA
ncbi:MAG: DNA repair protein RecN [Candidatus Eremiobacterota bacterium]